ncbi:MAG TPA: MarR family transcriptional regulator, partial [Bradyrhizobium sp.]
MPQTKRTPAGEALSDLILDLFRLNSLLFTAGDRMVAGLGLTSARWQILGAIVTTERPQPVAWLARDLGA